MILGMELRFKGEEISLLFRVCLLFCCYGYGGVWLLVGVCFVFLVFWFCENSYGCFGVGDNVVVCD